MEEMNLFSENKTHLKQLGEQLITASNKTKEAEVNDKLKDVNDRWQHLFDHIEARWDQTQAERTVGGSGSAEVLLDQIHHFADVFKGCLTIHLRR